MAAVVASLSLSGIRKRRKARRLATWWHRSGNVVFLGLGAKNSHESPKLLDSISNVAPNVLGGP